MHRCSPFLLLAPALLLGCGAGDEPERGSPESPFRVAVIKFQHETCTFCPGGDTEIEDWTRLGPPLKGKGVLTADSYLRGFTSRAREYGGVELVGIESPDEVFGGSSRSWSTRATFDHFMDRILADLELERPIDDVFVVKSRVHFRRGFDETGFAKTILVVDAPGPFVGTTRLDALDYRQAPIERLYPFAASTEGE